MSDATITDLYEVTMAMSYLREGMTGPATFSLFVRDMPPNRGFLVAAGLESSLDFLSGFRVDAEDVDAFASALHRPPRDLAPLLGLEFTGRVRAVPEGWIVLAGEPLLEVTAPLPQALSANARSWTRPTKMVEYDGRPVMKLSSAKVTAPGQKQVFRCPRYTDVIGLRDEGPPGEGVPLLETVMRNGRRTVERPTLDESGERFAADMAGLPPAARRIQTPLAPRARTSGELTALADRGRRRIEDDLLALSADLRRDERSATGSQRSVPR
ncbi:hypothetical protein AB0J81_27555 [Streptomyces bobili]|uniref:hypothetical protein n=1 Tax=Streptomyces bobili TaxID=67280 RepID=UPI0034428DEA